jgi:hypothetical protein
VIHDVGDDRCKHAMTLLSEFPQQVIASHALVAAEVMSGEKPRADTLLELTGEAITVDRLTDDAAGFDPAGV